jgi:hypothetical protein
MTVSLDALGLVGSSRYSTPRWGRPATRLTSVPCDRTQRTTGAQPARLRGVHFSAPRTA